MSTAKIAVIGSGISGAVCASILAKNGVCVTMFESARGPGGRMSQRREISSDGNELSFDHGAPYFTARNTEVMGLANEWESRGLVAEWKNSFGSFDCSSGKFSDIEQEEEEASKRYVGVPGMNSICKALCRDPGVESRFGISVGRLEWIEDRDSWSLTSSDGQDLGKFNGVVASDKNIVSPRFTSVTGRPPPLDLDLVTEMKEKLQNIPVHPCFALMLAFKEPLSSIPLKGFSIRNSEVLSSAYCDSTKPGRSTDCERWVVHSTLEYAERLISQTGLSKPTEALLAKVSEEILGALKNARLVTSHPFHTKAHRWGSAFPARSVASEEKCVWDTKKRIAICGDFCVSPDVEGAIISGIAAASKFNDIPSSL